MPGEVFRLKKLLPQTPEFDFNIHIMDFDPGEYLNVKVRWMSSGLPVLSYGATAWGIASGLLISTMASHHARGFARKFWEDYSWARRGVQMQLLSLLISLIKPATHEMQHGQTNFKNMLQVQSSHI